ncbi:Conserved_hypothetical protein [Hexamita inflata]|uniref:Pyridoxamine 5'-phosphate oxidase putative domain-containing protein n=1 Tax=Hexamita inflata TaxID=28002 RepID=A0AA86UDJ5_9EUKA|nr:Conserved hypothetical protein [Hexamita inflata]
MAVWSKLSELIQQNNAVHVTYIDLDGYPQIAPMYCYFCKPLNRFIVNCRPLANKVNALQANQKATWYFGPIDKYNLLYVQGNIKIIDNKFQHELFLKQWIETDSQYFKNFDPTHLMLMIDAEKIVESAQGERTILWQKQSKQE